MGLHSLFHKLRVPSKVPEPLEPAAEKCHKSHDRDAQRSPKSRGSVAPSLYSTLPTLKFEMMANYLCQEQLKRKWIKDCESDMEGSFIRKGLADYVTCPAALANPASKMTTAVAALNPQVCTMESPNMWQAEIN